MKWCYNRSLKNVNNYLGLGEIICKSIVIFNGQDSELTFASLSPILQMNRIHLQLAKIPK